MSIGRVTPPLGATLNPAHPLAQGLFAGWLLNDGAGLKSVQEVTRRLPEGVLANPHSEMWSKNPSSMIQGMKFNSSMTLVCARARADLSAVSKFTAVQWINSTAGNVTLANSNGDDPQFYIPSNVRFTFGISVTAGPNILDGIWHMLCGIYDGTNLYLYIDGLLVGSAGPNSFTRDFSSTAVTTRIGWNSDGGYQWPGWIGPTLLYHRCLDVLEIRTLYLDPYCFMRSPVTRRAYSVLAGGFKPSWSRGSNVLIGVA